MALIKQVGINVLLVGVVTVLALVCAELALHVMPRSVTGIARTLPLAPNSHTAFTLKPDTVTHVESSCYSALVSSNRDGFRDTDWVVPQDIVVLGDSFMEAQQVSDGEEFASLVEKSLGRPVANLGIASYNTVSALKAYEAYGSSLKPKIVLLAFYTGNDVDGNNCSGNYRPNGTLTNACGAIQDGDVAFPENYYSMSGHHNVRSFLREHCVLCKLLRDRVSIARMSGVSSGIPARDSFALYLPEGSAGSEIDTSWSITEAALTTLRDKVVTDGARLVVMTVPGYIDYAPTGSEEFAASQGPVPEDFNPTEPQRRLDATLEGLHIEHFSLIPSFKSYLTAHEVPKPYFSFSCDGHWNQLGHTVAATAFIEYLTNSSR